MDTSIFSSVLDHYQWQLSLYAVLGIIVVTVIAQRLFLLVPAFRQTQALNQQAAEERKTRSFYEPIQKRVRVWGLLTDLGIFVLILPFCLTLEPQPLWSALLDIFVILMVYDFFYYLTHRFLFHDGPLGGPLIWVHAVHHQQRNPCRRDSSYLHPLEPVIGLLLYAATIAGLSVLMGPFHVATIVVTWIAFSEINLHNHDLMEVHRFPYKYLKYMSYMHHVHHARFTAGNFATISLFYDWLFGTYDTGDGYKKKTVPDRPKPQAADPR